MRASPAGPDHRRRRNRRPVEGHDAEAPGQVDRLHRCRGDARRGRRDEHLGHAGAALVAAGHEQMVCLTGRLHDRDLTPQDEVGPRPAGLHGRLPPRRTEGRRAPGGDALSGEQAGQDVGRGVVGAQGGRHHVDHRQRPRRGVAAELVGDQAGVHQAGVADGAAAVLFAHQQRGPSQLGAAAPVGRVEPDRVVAQLAQGVRWRLLGQEAVGGLAEELLVFAQVQEHGAP